MSFDLEAATVEVLARLRASLGAAHAFDGDAVAVMDSDGRAHPYAALYVGPGADELEDYAACGDPGARRWTFQVTAAGGDPVRCRRAVQRVLTALSDVSITAGGRPIGPIRLDGDPGPARTDTSTTPHRTYLPLIFTAET